MIQFEIEVRVDCSFLKGCPAGFFGFNCKAPCRCENDATCDAASGQCYCPSGWTGEHCESACPPGRFGFNCTQECQCYNGATCDKQTGCCNCSSGWHGQHCQLGLLNCFPF